MTILEEKRKYDSWPGQIGSRKLDGDEELQRTHPLHALPTPGVWRCQQVGNAHARVELKKTSPKFPTRSSYGRLLTPELAGMFVHIQVRRG